MRSRIGITGARLGISPCAFHTLTTKVVPSLFSSDSNVVATTTEELEVHRGDCVGADAEMHQYFLESFSTSSAAAHRAAGITTDDDEGVDTSSSTTTTTPSVIFPKKIRGGLKLVIHPPDKDHARAFCCRSPGRKEEEPKEKDKRSTAVSFEIREPKPFLARNRDIVDQSDVLLAFPPTEEEVLRSGSWSTIRYARKLKKPVFTIFPSGKLNVINLRNHHLTFAKPSIDSSAARSKNKEKEDTKASQHDVIDVDHQSSGGDDDDVIEIVRPHSSNRSSHVQKRNRSPK